MPARDDDLRDRLLATFRVEAEEHVASLTDSLLALDRGLPAEQEREIVQAAFRAMHTLKGAARSVALMEVEAVCQACEALLSRATQGQLVLTPDIVDRLQEAVDAIPSLVAGDVDPATVSQLVTRLEQVGTGPAAAHEEGGNDGAPAVAPAMPLEPPEPAQPQPSDRSADVIRLDAGKLDALLLEGEQLLATKLAVSERASEARALVTELARSRERLRGARRRPGGNGAAGDGHETAAMQELGSAAAGARALFERLSVDQRAVALAVDRLLEEIRAVRMTPVSTVLDLFPRMVRDLARGAGKDVEWSAHGRELELDRRVLQSVKDPLIHLVRNAIDHGIESPQERADAGKPARGRVEVTVASLEDGRVEILVEDDGRGIDPHALREAAVRARVVSPEDAPGLGIGDAVELAFRSGLSTTPVITDVSGHGLGLAIVREQVERLDGEIRIESEPGRATRARMVLPATIATFRGLLVVAAGQHFLLPLEATECVLTVSDAELEVVEGQEAIRFRGEPVPVARLAAVLGLGAEAVEPGADHRCAVVRGTHERAGLIVERVLGEREVLVKELSRPLVRVRHIAGAGLLGSGEVVLILRAADLVRAGRRALLPVAPRAAAKNDERPPRVLVVDDAVTTRTMERNLLEAAGYGVEVAVDGLEALTALLNGDFDLVVSDVDMPRMDGFELTARIRDDARLVDLPVVLVTALDSREDKERGVEVGANAYVVKSSFEQSNLLEIIARLGVAPGRGRG